MRMNTPGPDDIIATYERQAETYARQRAMALFERPMLSALMTHAPGPRVLDLGCGTGRPLAQRMAGRGAQVTGLDAVVGMLRHFRRNVPGGRMIRGDMRHHGLTGQYDAVLAWDSFFHLSHGDQARMIPRFRRWLVRGGCLVFSSGPDYGTVLGHVGSEQVYHSSFAPLHYRRMLTSNGFRVLRYRAEDSALDHHTWWLCQRVH